ncbi:DNA-processing protein DprA [Crenobacter cavernae]|uniref:DNA-protecting protein DprA n=1 Tax=Crenobacter cavernae TaxID=2290923 RepID=A0A345Y3V9_9NEIS|nr:DNA-processing protein DprA [Crenobacter cavernae]AXK38611.1 DNA-protecting protein DprA [Crenobacter cavernae]
MDAERRAWLTLALTPGLGPVGLLKLIGAFGSAGMALGARRAQLAPHIGEEAADALIAGAAKERVEAAEVWVDGTQGAFLLTLLDDDYPAPLAETHGPPPLLFARGRRELLGFPKLAVVGSRNATPQGLDNARAFSRELAKAGYTIVSGLASGIDAAAHEGALAAPASTIAVIGTGIDRIYPARNRELGLRLAEHGLILSEFPLGTGALAHNFPRRNRVIAGLSVGCLVVEANVESGSLITARLAAEAGREVLAIPGSIHNPQSRGCHRLIKDGAKLVETVDDVLAEVGRAPAPLAHIAPEKTETRPQAVERGEGLAEPPLLAAMGYDPVDVDTLSVRLKLTAGEVYAMLLELELEGCVAGLPGGRFQRLS